MSRSLGDAVNSGLCKTHSIQCKPYISEYDTLSYRDFLENAISQYQILAKMAKIQSKDVRFGQIAIAWQDIDRKWDKADKYLNQLTATQILGYDEWGEQDLLAVNYLIQGTTFSLNPLVREATSQDLNSKLVSDAIFSFLAAKPTVDEDVFRASVLLLSIMDLRDVPSTSARRKIWDRQKHDYAHFQYLTPQAKSLYDMQLKKNHARIADLAYEPIRCWWG